MNRRRLVAALFFSAVVVATLAVIVYAERASAGQALTVWMLTRDVVAGAPYSEGDVQQVRLSAPSSDFNYEPSGPAQIAARYGRTLHAKDILRADDLIADTAVAEVALTLQNPPPLNVGDTIDIFATLAGATEARIGHDLTVVTVSGSSVDVIVPAADEAAWVAVGSSDTSLHAARTVAGTESNPLPLSVDEAIGELCGSSCAAAATPAASASP